MKFQPDRAEGVHVVTRHEPGRIWVGATVHEGSLLVPWQGTVTPWPVTHPDGLTAAHFEQLLPLKPELVIFGSGARLRFVPTALYRCLVERGIGMETMDSPAAYRTYNVLAAEGRSVVGAFISVSDSPG